MDRVGQDLTQLGLSHEDDAHEVLVVQLVVGEKPDLIEHVTVRDELGLVHHDHRTAPLGMHQVERFRELFQQFVLGPRRIVDPKAPGDDPQKLQRREAGVEDEAEAARLAHGIHERPGNGGLAAADIAGQQGQLPLLHGVLKPRKGLPVPPRQEEVARIGGLGKRLFPQSIEFPVHLPPAPQGFADDPPHIHDEDRPLVAQVGGARYPLVPLEHVAQ